MLQAKLQWEIHFIARNRSLLKGNKTNHLKTRCKGIKNIYKVSKPNLVTYLIHEPILWVVASCWPKEQTPKQHVFRREWTTWSKSVNYSRSLLTWLRNLCNYLRRKRIFTLIMSKIFIWTPWTMRKMTAGLICSCNHLVLIVCSIS